MNILALDYGEKFIGVAYKINNGPTVPTDMILPQTENEILKLETIIRKLSIDLIVLGLPLDFSGKIGHQAKITKEFGNTLRETTKVRIEYSDERLTSKLIDENLPNSHSLVAAHILDNYIKRSKNEQK